MKKTRLYFVLAVILMFSLACGIPKIKKTSTPTPEPTTAVPSEEPTLAVPTQAASAKITADSSFEEILQILYDEEYISSTDGAIHELDDFEETTQLLDNYDWYYTDYSLDNFVLATHLKYEVADNNADLFNTGCGFIFRFQDSDNHYAITYDLDGSTQMWSYKNNEYTDEGTGSFPAPKVPKGEADLILIAEQDQITFFVDGEQAFQTKSNKFSGGKLAYVLMTGTDKSFGNRCSYSDTRILELPSSATGLSNTPIVDLGNNNSMTPDFKNALDMLKTDGAITTTNGDYFTLDDFDEKWAQIGWYQWYETGHSPGNFVIKADMTYASAIKTPDWASAGCGFVFRLQDSKNNYATFFAQDGNVYMWAYQNGKYVEKGRGYYGKHSVEGSANIIFAAEDNNFTFYVDGVKVFNKKDSAFSDGELFYSLQSGTNKDWGQHCTFTNVELLELP